MPLLSASSLHKSYAGVRALRGLSFDLAAGEVHALVGENGAGKSTFVRIISGAEAPDSGSLTIGGRAVTTFTPAAARQRGVVAIHQHPALFPDLTVAENIAFALEQGSVWARVDWRERAVRARALLDRVGASFSTDRLIDTLSLPEQQLVEIAKAIGAEASVLVMDEPTAALSDREIDRLFAVIDRVRQSGAGVVYISHRLQEIRRIADRLTVIRDGETVAAGLPANTDTDVVVGLMVGRTLAHDAVSAAPRPGDVVLDVRDLFSRAAGIASVSFSVRQGEILGIAGLVGSGRTELAETIFGLRPADAGTVTIGGKPAVFRSPAEAIAAGVAYVPEDRRRHGVLAAMSVVHNTTLASLGRVSSAGFVRRRDESRVAERFVTRFSIRTSSLATRVGSLSGGNQQKVALARWLATEPKLLILDEPTQGVDVAAKAEIHTLMRELAGQGLAIVMISSELPEILAMSDRIAVMRGGSLVRTIPRVDATEASILATALGHDDRNGAAGLENGAAGL